MEFGKLVIYEIFIYNPFQMKSCKDDIFDENAICELGSHSLYILLINKCQRSADNTG